MHTYKHVSYILIFTLLFFSAVSVHAQTEARIDTNQQTEVRASSDTDEKCEAGAECPEESVERAETNDVDADGDGYGNVETNERCEDGVCTEVREAGEFETGESEMNEDARAEANYNNSRSNRSTVVGDGEGGGQSDAAGTDATGEIILGEDRDMVMPGDNKSDLDDNDNTDRANYNNSRSNRASIVGDGSDGPLDRTRKGAVKELDKASPKLMTALSIDDDSPIKGEGVELYVRSDICGIGDEDCDDNGVPANVSPRDLTLHVSGERVRGWSPDQKAELARRLQVAGTSTTASDFGLRVAQAAVDNEDVAEIVSEENKTEVHFRTRMRLLGFIPTQVNATARADAGGEVEVDYPWYGFLASKGDSSIFSSLAAELRAAHDVMVSPVNDPPQTSEE